MPFAFLHVYKLAFPDMQKEPEDDPQAATEGTQQNSENEENKAWGFMFDFGPISCSESKCQFCLLTVFISRK